jgi:hypothetical protein
MGATFLAKVGAPLFASFEIVLGGKVAKTIVTIVQKLNKQFFIDTLLFSVDLITTITLFRDGLNMLDLKKYSVALWLCGYN